MLKTKPEIQQGRRLWKGEGVAFKGKFMKRNSREPISINSNRNLQLFPQKQKGSGMDKPPITLYTCDLVEGKLYANEYF